MTADLEGQPKGEDMTTMAAEAAPNGLTDMVTTSVETITPEQAEALLGHDHTNRKVRWTVVERYANDMRAGRWKVGGSTLDFDADGNLLNGQHRLHACVQAEVNFQAIVVRGLPEQSQIVMDVGLRRSLSDILAWQGETNTAALAASVNMGWKWENGKVNTTLTPTHQEALEWLTANPNIREAVRRTIGLRELLAAPQSALAVFTHQITLLDFEDAESFLKHLREGDELPAGDPILAMRNWAINQITRKASGAKPGALVYLAMLVKSWNAWVLGRSLNNMVWRRGGTRKEDFPELLDHDGQAVPVKSELAVA